MRDQTQKHFDNILNTMTAADGGARFGHFMFGMREIDEAATKGDEKCKEIVEVMARFSRLIDALQPKVKKS